MQRLGKNLSSYQGETIDIHRVLADTEAAAARTGWQLVPVEPLGQRPLPAFQRLVPNPQFHLYISSGVHGDEPAGPLAVLQLFQQAQWPANACLWIIPCLNPGGFVLNRRENEDGVDLNRDYRSPRTETVRAHARWLEARPRFDMSLCLHEDWESHGFYLYELNPDLKPSLAQEIIAQVRPFCPIDTSPLIEGRKAEDGIICANPDLQSRPDWPEAFYLIHHKTRLSYTLESPSDFLLATRVDGLVAGVRAVLSALQRRSAS